MARFLRCLEQESGRVEISSIGHESVPQRPKRKKEPPGTVTATADPDEIVDRTDSGNLQ
jgi:hypothetical protein